MTLNVNMRDVADYESFSENDQFVIGVMTMHTGMPVITAENVGEFFERIHMVESVIGAARVSSEGPVRYTMAEVRRYVGLQTNVSPHTKTKFNANVIRMLREHARSAAQL